MIRPSQILPQSDTVPQQIQKKSYYQIVLHRIDKRSAGDDTEELALVHHCDRTDVLLYHRIDNS